MMERESEAARAVESALKGKKAYCKFLSANDTGLTGGHQAGIYIHKPAFPIIFDKPGAKGSNMERRAKITWQGDFETGARFIYYGQGTRNEYRITHFGRGFPLLCPEYTGALFVLSKLDEENYQAWVLNSEDGIDEFLAAFGIAATEANRLIDTFKARPEARQEAAIKEHVASLGHGFPSSEEMAAAAREIQNSAYNHLEYIRTNPDRKIIEWTDVEYALFRAIERQLYGEAIARGFESVDAFVAMANTVLNRRKSRAGKSLELHLAAIFDGNGIAYSAQGTTEGHKRPDFIFPSQEAYRDAAFPAGKIITLAAKTTCKDRWRQVINEAARLRGLPKYLCTLQQGISPAQMDEMQAENVILVVPKPYIASYPADRRGRILTLLDFVSRVREMEGL